MYGRSVDSGNTRETNVAQMWPGGRECKCSKRAPTEDAMQPTPVVPVWAAHWRATQIAGALQGPQALHERLVNEQADPRHCVATPPWASLLAVSPSLARLLEHKTGPIRLSLTHIVSMDVASVELRASIHDWDEADVHAWLSTLGLPQYENQIRGTSSMYVCASACLTDSPEHRVSGDVLCLMDAESLKEVGISTIGQRLAILKAVYQLKLAHQIPIDADHYVPPCKIHSVSSAINNSFHYQLR